MRFRSLESRIASVFLVLIVVLQLASLVAINIGIANHARGFVSEQLEVGGRVLRQVLQQNGQKLIQGARLLAADFGFKAAVSPDSGSDPETINSALQNHVARINASLAMFVDSNRNIVASTIAEPAPAFIAFINEKLDLAERNDGVHGLAVVNQKTFQIVIVPVKAPNTIGWVVMAFPLDQKLAQEMRALSGLDVMILSGQEGAPRQFQWQMQGSTMNHAANEDMLRQLSVLADAGEKEESHLWPQLEIAALHHGAYLLKIGKNGDQVTAVLLLHSLEASYAQYYRLQWLLLGLTVAGIGLAWLGSGFVAKRLAQPLRLLAQQAKRLEGGDYLSRIEVAQKDEVGELAKALDSMRDGIARRQDEITRLAYFDYLTGLPNRIHFLRTLQQGCATVAGTDIGGNPGSVQSGEPLHHENAYVLFMDLNRFKHVNDLLGHSVGDLLLQKVAQCIEQEVRQLLRPQNQHHHQHHHRHHHAHHLPLHAESGPEAGAVHSGATLEPGVGRSTQSGAPTCLLYELARMSGDEFALYVPGPALALLHPTGHTDSAEEQVDFSARALYLAQAIIAALESPSVPIVIEEQAIDVGISIGIACFPQHANGPEALISHAEVAMYCAKQRGSGVMLYDPALDQSSAQNLSLLSQLRKAVSEQQLRLYVQPKLELSSGKLVGVEALVRWQHPDRGMVFPDQFIPFAEQTGFIRQITRWIMQESAQFCARMRAQGLHLKVSVNLSTRDLMDQDLPAKFAEDLRLHQLPASAFCLEITESAIMDDPQKAQATLQKLHEMGFDLSIDDFGTGYSSLAYLKRLPVNELKIDKSFVLNLEKDASDTKIVRSTIDLGHIMGLRVVAEGIEGVNTWHLLAKLGCDQGQGYFMGRPLPAADLPAWAARWQAPVPPEE